MTEIIISKNITTNKLHEYYDYYINNIKYNEVNLIIPSEFNRYTFGLLADLLRFIITLNIRKKIKILKFDGEVEDLDMLYDQEYAYPIISLLWNNVKFTDRAGKNIKEILRLKQNEFFVKMNGLAKIKGTKYILTSSDHLPNHKGLIRLFENSYGFNDDEDQIKKNIREILLNYVLTYSKTNSQELESDIGDIGGIIYELIKNTYEWGKTDANLVEIDSSIRGVYLRFHKNKLEKLVKDNLNNPLSIFFNHEQLRYNCNDQGNIHYLEISVFDSGVGFIEKFTSKGNLDNMDIIKKCLIKNQTSSSSNMKSKKGIGLDRILKIVDDKGFLKISTDKYTVCRDLIEDKYKPIDIENLEELVLNSWNKTNKMDDYLRAQGSYISILYPFKKNIFENG